MDFYGINMNKHGRIVDPFDEFRSWFDELLHSSEFWLYEYEFNPRFYG